VTGSSRSYFIFFLYFGHTEIETKPTNLLACSCPFLALRNGLLFFEIIAKFLAKISLWEGGQRGLAAISMG
jgi:hypothetical protein